MSFLRSLRAQYLDTSFKTGDGSTVARIIERPGRWMSQENLEALSANLRRVAAQTLGGGELSYGVFSADRARMEDSIITLVCDTETGRPLAFSALAVMELEINRRPVEVFHLGLVMVAPDERSQGFSWVLYGLTCVLLFLRSGFRSLYVSNVTQVPAVIGMVCETFSDVFPQPGDEHPTDFFKLLLARGIMAKHRHVFGVGKEAEFDEAAFIIRNAYTGGSDDLKKTFDEATKHRDDKYNSYCAERLDYARGDDVLQIGAIDLNAVRRFVLRSVPRGSLKSTAALGSLVMLRRVVIPVLQWFDTTRTFGILRPRGS